MIDADDEKIGPKEMKIGILADTNKNVVVIQFENPISWITFPPAFVRAFAKSLIESADLLEKTNPELKPN